MDTVAIVAEILSGYAMHPRGLHGVVHWARVMENGWKLAEITGADRDVMTLFALFHDPLAAFRIFSARVRHPAAMPGPVPRRSANSMLWMRWVSSMNSAPPCVR